MHISMMKTCVTGLSLKDKNAISHSKNSEVISIKSRLIFNVPITVY